VTNNNGFWIGRLDLLALLLQLLLITITYNSSQSLAKTFSIPSWTTRVFSSTVTDLVLIYESVTSSASVVRWLTLHSWTLSSLKNESSFTADDLWMNQYDCLELTNEFSCVTRGEPTRDHHNQQFVYWSLLSVAPGVCLLNRYGARKPVLIPGQRLNFYQLIRRYETRCQRAVYQQWTFASARCPGNACLASSRLAMDVYPDFTFPAFSRHVTIIWYTLHSSAALYVKVKTDSRLLFRGHPFWISMIQVSSYLSPSIRW
jgi:hypothetical protein